VSSRLEERSVECPAALAEAASRATDGAAPPTRAPRSINRLLSSVDGTAHGRSRRSTVAARDAVAAGSAAAGRGRSSAPLIGQAGVKVFDPTAVAANGNEPVPAEVTFGDRARLLA
jgi:hypothetical protein